MNWRRAFKVILAVALLLVVGVSAVQAFPGLVGADYALVVQSGSMEPAIPTGSVVFVRDVPAERVEEGNVITFADDGGNLITHRVARKFTADDSLRFRTKGDANENLDAEPVYRDDLAGVVIFSVPYIGYLVSFAGTRAGWISFVVVPCVLLIASELWELYGALEPVKEKTNE